MKTNKFGTVYVGISVTPTTQLLEAQTRLCSNQQLAPRPEFHLTLAYFGEVSQSDVNKLGNALSSLMNEDLKKLQITGLGGACESNTGEIRAINSLSENTCGESPRVFWWSILLTDAIVNFRNSLISSAINLGLPNTYLRPTIWPHLTIGSGGPTNKPGDWELWDVHTIPKQPTVVEASCPKEIIVERIHITSVPVQPDSLFVIG